MPEFLPINTMFILFHSVLKFPMYNDWAWFYLLQPFIIRLMDVIDTPEKIYIVMEAAGGGELFDRLVYNGRLPEATAKFYFYQLALAIEYLHSKKITHRDIKVQYLSAGTTLFITRKLNAVATRGLHKMIIPNFTYLHKL